MKIMNILGVRIDNLSQKEILEKIASFLSDGNFHQIATVNAEFILKAQEDEEFKKILNLCDLNIADSISIRYAFFRFGKWLKVRMAGADLMERILKMANEKKLSVFLAINKNGLSSFEEIQNILNLKYPGIRFFGENIDLQNIYRPKINCKLLFCNFGAPDQEKFINSLKNDTIGLVAMGVGGSFDFLTGKMRRAPKIMRQLGLEWSLRLILQPQRWKRIYNAVIIFPIKVLFNK